ncbi:MAG TPA: aspartate kinase [Blastocatellia bacterium]
MIVMKFGGTSVEDPECIERVARIIRDRLAQRPAVVVSAMGKTTRMLLEAAHSSATGDSESATLVVSELKTRHLSHAHALIAGKDRPEISLIAQHFNELQRLLEGLAVLGEVPPRGLDKILSYGELLSSVIVSGALSERGITSKLMDARRFIKTDDRYGMASPIKELTNQLTRDTVGPVVESGAVPVIQGFIGSARHGATTTLGFEGSDYTAALVGAALGADDIQIWKDVSGLMTADPAIFASARTVKACSYREAGELTYFGAKVLHPKAIYPAAEMNIPVHIYNSRRPAATGTAITAYRVPCSNAIKSIAYKRPVSVIRLSSNRGPWGGRDEGGLSDSAGSDSLLRAALDRCHGRGIAPLLAAAAGSNAIVAVEGTAIEEDNGRYLMDELRTLGFVEINKQQAIVSVVGEELNDHRDLASQMISALRGINIGVILQGSSSIGINMVVGHDGVEDAVTRLHDLCFRDPDPLVFE